MMDRSCRGRLSARSSTSASKQLWPVASSKKTFKHGLSKGNLHLAVQAAAGRDSMLPGHSPARQRPEPWQLVSATTGVAMLLCNLQRSAFVMVVPLLASPTSFALSPTQVQHLLRLRAREDGLPRGAAHHPVTNAAGRPQARERGPRYCGPNRSGKCSGHSSAPGCAAPAGGRRPVQHAPRLPGRPTTSRRAQ